MGLLTEPCLEFLNNQKQSVLNVIDIDETAIDQLIAQRYEARQGKNWELSDQIRDKLLAYNIELKDGPDGTSWTVKKD